VKRSGAARLALGALMFSTCAPAASQTAPAAGTGFSGVGNLTASTAFGGTPVQLAGEVAFEAQGALSRIDFVSVGIAGGPSGATIRILPPGGFSIVYDKAHSLYTIWVPSKRAYFTGKPQLPNPQASPAPTPAASASPAADSNPFSIVKGFSNLQTLSIGVDLTGHDVIDGHPTTDFGFHYDATDKSGSPTSIHGTAAFADDVGEAPLRVTVTYKGKGTPESNAAIAITSLQQRTVPATDFAPPPGYARVNALSDLMSGGAILTPPH
jgi:hypothetical protein